MGRMYASWTSWAELAGQHRDLGKAKWAFVRFGNWTCWRPAYGTDGLFSRSILLHGDTLRYTIPQVGLVEDNRCWATVHWDVY